MKFDEYHFNPKIKKALSELGYKRPTDIQYKSIPNILKGEDLLAVAQTGTGKTAAFAIPLIDKLYEKKINQRRASDVNCLVLVPTHELALQIHEVFEKIAKYTTLKTMALIGGVDQDPQIMKLYKGIDIIIATPGRVFDLISQGALLTHHIEILVLDEADHMLDLGFIKDIEDLIRKLPKRKQTLFFSATINDKIKKIAYSLVRQNAIRIQLSPKDPVAKKVDHSVMYVDMDHKRFFLERVVRENPDAKILAFVRTRVRAERVMKAMERAGIKALTIHGEKEQEERLDVLNKFKNGDIKLVIATDVAARGIDIPNVEIVVNYDLPDESENYVHRVGRTGRANNKGFAYTFCSPEEVKILEEIQGFIHKEIKVLTVDLNDYEDTLHVDLERKNDYKTLMDEINSFDDNRKKKKRKKK
ncbi:DEAD/DEAH box helicase [Portibacter lacus]|uniref:DEAD/DEAH box helicase n=1 Tax=Portibacter lacus TaxID=1099794 RepID=A0AA37SLA2_9BACT|nr:DEAD/DEAH box helicase [Portibacter lacus]GLR16231.1 DEAD/DEAH box helicase [Portibacter lacus]